MADNNVEIELSAVIVSLGEEGPRTLTAASAAAGSGVALPSGPFATEHRTLEQGLRDWAGVPLGYVEQLYTFADRDRVRQDGARRIVSIGYLALVRAFDEGAKSAAAWSPWYRYFPWEDHREGVPPILGDVLRPALMRWVEAAADDAAARRRRQRIAIAFPKDVRQWNEELVLQRYELLWEAGLVEEAFVPAQGAGRAVSACASLGQAMAHDHRRILATAMARLRAKIKYRPVVFELMPETFTLLQLQEAVEALAGLRLHKQNFRRLVAGQGLVEETGAVTRGVSGRPAKLFAFRKEVLAERAAAGTKLPRVG